MTYYECEGCGQLVPLTDQSGGARHERCPECEEVTTWTVAFEAEEGVSF